jgi:hypothetical protein
VGRDCEELVVPWVLTVRKQPQETRRQGYWGPLTLSVYQSLNKKNGPISLLEIMELK